MENRPLNRDEIIRTLSQVGSTRWLPIVAMAVIVLSWIIIVATNSTVPDQVFASPVYSGAFIAILIAGVILFAPTVYRHKITALWIFLHGVSANLIGAFGTHLLEVPLYFAIGGTVFIAFAAGPLAGMAVGAFSAVLGSLIAPVLLPMVLLLVVPGMLMWMAMMEGWTSTVARLSATGCALVLFSSAVMLINRLTIFNGIYHNGAQNLTNFIVMVEPNPVTALIYQTLITQFLDKLLFLFLGNAALQVLLPRTRLHRLCIAEPAMSIVKLLMPNEPPEPAQPVTGASLQGVTPIARQRRT